MHIVLVTSGASEWCILCSVCWLWQEWNYLPLFQQCGESNWCISLYLFSCCCCKPFNIFQHSQLKWEHGRKMCLTLKNRHGTIWMLACVPGTLLAHHPVRKLPGSSWKSRSSALSPLKVFFATEKQDMVSHTLSNSGIFVLCGFSTCCCITGCLREAHGVTLCNTFTHRTLLYVTAWEDFLFN